MDAVTICSDFGAPKNKVWHCFHCFPIYFPRSDGTRCYDLRFLNGMQIYLSSLVVCKSQSSERFEWFLRHPTCYSACTFYFCYSLIYSLVSVFIFLRKALLRYISYTKVSLKLNIQKTKIVASSPITPWQVDGETVETVETVSDFIFLGSKITADGDCSYEIKRRLLLVRKVMTNLDSILKKQRHYFVNKGPSSQGYGFSSSHVWIWELDCEEGWVLKNWCFWTVVLEKTLESTLDCKKIQPVHSNGDQSWVFIGRTDVEAEASILWPPDVKSWFIWKYPNAGKD